MAGCQRANDTGRLQRLPEPTTTRERSTSSRSAWRWSTRSDANKTSPNWKRLLRNYLPDDDPMPTTLKIERYRPGPGNELKKMIAWFAKPSETCNCETRVDTMNDWGAEGCRRNIDTIVDWLLEEAQVRGLPHGRFTATIARSLVNTAIRKFERKFPEGAPEPDQDDPEDEFDR